MTKEELIKNQFPNDEFLQSAVSLIVDKCVADLERKLEQTEKDLADYQFNYPTIKELEAKIEKMKRHANCKHCDSEGYCEIKKTYLIDLSYDGCDKWELED